MPPSSPPPLIIGISGLSSSGKTTIATHLAHILPHSVLLHEDDFYHPEATLPLRANGVRDWDCPQAIDTQALCACLRAWLHHGTAPPQRKSQGATLPPPPPPTTTTTAAAAAVSQEEDAAAQQHPESAAGALARLRSRALLLFPQTPTPTPPPRILILEGILLFPPSMSPLPALLSTKILLRVPRAEAARRREAREGYVTVDGFWRDPEGYFADVVWGNFKEAHGRYFVGGDVEGDVDLGVCAREGVRVGPVGERVMGVLEWVLGVVGECVGRVGEEDGEDGEGKEGDG